MMPFCFNSSCLLFARSFVSAVRKILTSASGNTTVPWSRPSVTMILFSTAKCLCISTSFARIFGAEAMYFALSVTLGVLICSVTSRRLIVTVILSLRYSKLKLLFFRQSRRASWSVKSIFEFKAANVSARYIEPVSRKYAFIFLARSFAIVLLPLAAGPSIVTINLFINYVFLNNVV